MKLKKFEQQPKHVENIPIEAINLDSEQEQPPKPDKAVGKNVFQPNSKYFTIVITGLQPSSHWAIYSIYCHHFLLVP